MNVAGSSDNKDSQVSRADSSGSARKWNRWLIVAILLAGFAVLAQTQCVPPQIFKDAKVPHDGKPIGSKVAVVYHNDYTIRFFGAEKNHPHPQKYDKFYLGLIKAGLIKPDEVYVPQEATEKQITLAHSKKFIKSLKDSKEVADYLEAPVIGAAPNWLVDSVVLAAFRKQVGGTILAAELAKKYGIGINLGGGYHHAKEDHGEGFCIYNDLAIAIRCMQKKKLIKRALVIDLDVHQGNGTAEIFEDDKTVYTFSMHQGNIYPVPKSESDWDIELASGTTDKQYLAKLKAALPKLFKKAKPDMVFLQAGADVLKGDKLASLKLTPAGLKKRDQMVIEACVKRKIPVVYTTGGGYGKNSWKAQLASISNIIKKYGLEGKKSPHKQRNATWYEDFYTN